MPYKPRLKKGTRQLLNAARRRRMVTGGPASRRRVAQDLNRYRKRMGGGALRNAIKQGRRVRGSIF